jgi:hypothetical protein
LECLVSVLSLCISMDISPFIYILLISFAHPRDGFTRI